MARGYQCAACLAKQQPKTVRVATLRKSPHFNHTLAIDTFYIQWNNKKEAILTMLDEFSRYEIDVHITEETAEIGDSFDGEHLDEVLWISSSSSYGTLLDHIKDKLSLVGVQPMA